MILSNNISGAPSTSAVRDSKRNIEAAYPLSPMQQGMLFHSLYAPGSGVYFEQLECKLTGDLNLAAFQRAWQQVVDRHPILRTAFAWRRLEKPVQAVYKELTLPVDVRDLRGLTPTRQEQEVATYLAADRAKGFDLSRAPLLRLALMRTGEQEYQLVWSHHHILMDGWTMPVLLKEVFTFYEAFAHGRTASLPLPRPYKDYIMWLQARAEAGDMAVAETYWRTKLAGWDAPTPLSVALENGSASGTAEREVRLSAEATANLNALARQNGVTLSTVLQAAWAILLSRYSGERDVVFGATVSGRPPDLPGADAMVGLFINTLPVRVQVDRDATLSVWLREFQVQLAELRQFEYTPLVQVQGWAGVGRDKPLFDTIIVFENYPVDAALREQLGSLQISGVRSFEQTNYPITLVSGPSRELALKISYDRSRFDEPAIQRMLNHLATLLQGMTATPAAALRELPLITEAEHRQLVVDWNHTDRGLEPGSSGASADTIHEAFEAQAARTPDALAVLAEERSLTYDELNRRANQLAHRLRALGVKREQIVGLLFERSPEMLVALLAILKAGAAYLPLDPDYPTERLGLMLSDSGAAVLLTQAHLADRLAPAVLAPTLQHVLCVDAPTVEHDGCLAAWGGVDEESAENLEPVAGTASLAAPDSLAYVIYTSGSTGTPKGVMVEHRNVLNHTRALIELTGIGPGDRMLQFVSLSFDAAGEEFYPTLLSGAALVVPSQSALIGPGLAMFCEQHAITIMHMPAAVWHTVINDLVEREAQCSAPLRLLMLGGDAPDPARLAAFSKLLGREIPFINLYGPTEATITTTAYPTTTLAAGTNTQGRIPIGRPIANAQVYVLDAAGQPAPVGVAGEIYIGGAGVARGYLNRAALTAERFVPIEDYGLRITNSSQFSILDSQSRLYRTGDLGRWLPDGAGGAVLEFLGRVDNQVKIRGFRVEPGEIEAALKREPGVREAVIVPWEDGAAGKRLVAYVVPANGARPDPAVLRAALRKHLPDYMTPSAFVILPALPLTATGKVDRAALRSARLQPPEGEHLATTSGFVAPRTPEEDLLVGIFTQVLGLTLAPGVNDSFFDLGGHSLLATRLASRIREVFGVELALRDLFEAPTVAGIAAQLRAARQAEAVEPAPPITPVSRADETGNEDLHLPLSFAQQRLWFLDQLEPGNLFYNIPTVMRLKGSLDIDALTAALNEVVRRHEALRTTFAARGGVPYQLTAQSMSVTIPVTDLTGLPANEREARALDLARAEIRQPFDLAAGPLLRARLIRLDDAEHIAVLTIHHIVTDGWSMGVLVAELAKLYEAYATGAPPVLPDLPIQYADYAAWQRAWLEHPTGDDASAADESPLQKQLAYWKQQLAGVPALLSLPTDRPRPAVQSSSGSTYTFSFSSALSDDLLKLSRKEGVTLFMTLLAGYQALLARYSGQGDIVVGSALANRQRTEVEPLIGFFVNTLVFRTRFDPGPTGAPLTFKELLGRVRETALGAYAHQDAPFEMLVDAVQPERNLSHSPLFQAAFSLQNVPVPERELSGLTLEAVNLDKGIAGYDMLLQVTETGQGLACAWEYNTDLFDPATIERMAIHLQTLLAAAVADPSRSVATLPILTERERRMMLVEWNDTAVPFPSARTIHSLFEDQAQRIPDAVAAVFAIPASDSAQTLTYAGLDRRANQLAQHLVSLGVQPNTLVGIAVERSLEMVVGILGILKAGGAYLPLDPNYPSDRLAFMLADAAAGAGLQVVLTQAHLIDKLPLKDEGLTSQGKAHSIAHIVRLDADWPVIAGLSEHAPQVSVTAEDLAYCIYTSGSTGRPKGTLLRHRGLCNLADVHNREFDMAEGKRVLQFSPFSFDASVWETVMALRNGATLVLTRQEVLASGPDLLKLLQEQRVTTATLPPSLLSILSPAELPDLDTVIAAGERCTNEIMKAWGGSEGTGGRSFFNAYGPTETTVCASMHRCNPSTDWPFGGPPVGKPLSNFQLYVVDENLEPQPIGVPGELLIGGVGLAKGYLNRPDLTAARFIRNPFAQEKPDFFEKPGFWDARLYRTGDLVRWLPSGDLEFLGRIDDQVKVRGYRIELGEIESVLREHPSVKDAVVTARDDALIGYVIPATAEVELPVTELRHALRAHLRGRLPEYMLPAAFVFMDAFPLSPAGKIDRKSLPAPDQARREVAAAYVAPRTETEQRLAALAAELLHLERVGVEDNFFELGGHSLLATQLISRIREEFKVAVALKTLFERPTVAGLAEVIDAGRTRQAAEAAKVADALALVKGMTPEQVKALLAAKKARAAGGKAEGE